MTAEEIAAPAPGVPRHSDGHGWPAVAVVLTGAFMALLDSTTHRVSNGGEHDAEQGRVEGLPGTAQDG